MRSAKPVNHLNRRLNRASVDNPTVSIVWEMHKRENNEIPPHFIHEIKTKGNDIIHTKIAHDLAPRDQSIPAAPSLSFHIYKTIHNVYRYSTLLI